MYHNTKRLSIIIYFRVWQKHRQLKGSQSNVWVWKAVGDMHYSILNKHLTVIYCKTVKIIVQLYLSNKTESLFQIREYKRKQLKQTTVRIIFNYLTLIFLKHSHTIHTSNCREAAFIPVMIRQKHKSRPKPSRLLWSLHLLITMREEESERKHCEVISD